MEVTADEMEQVREMIKTAVSNALREGINGVDKKLDDLTREVIEIKRVIVGDDEFHQTGMKEEHDEMYENYKGAEWFLKNIKTIVAGVVTLLAALVAWIINLLER